jgi:hypothetical protein
MQLDRDGQEGTPAALDLVELKFEWLFKSGQACVG